MPRILFLTKYNSSYNGNWRLHGTPYPMQSWGKGHWKGILNSCFVFLSTIYVRFVREPCITGVMVSTQRHAPPYLSEYRISNSYSALRELLILVAWCWLGGEGGWLGIFGFWVWALLAAELTPGGVDSSCHPSEVGEMSKWEMSWYEYFSKYCKTGFWKCQEGDLCSTVFKDMIRLK